MITFFFFFITICSWGRKKVILFQFHYFFFFPNIILQICNFLLFYTRKKLFSSYFKHAWKWNVMRTYNKCVFFIQKFLTTKKQFFPDKRKRVENTTTKNMNYYLGPNGNKEKKTHMNEISKHLWTNMQDVIWMIVVKWRLKWWPV